MTRLNKDLVVSMMEVAGYIPPDDAHMVDTGTYMLDVQEYCITFIPNKHGEYAIDVYNDYLDKSVKRLSNDEYLEIIELIKENSLVLELISDSWYN